MKFRHVSSLIFNTPLMIEAGKLEVILRSLGDRLDLDVEMAEKPMGNPLQRQPYTVKDGVAIIDVLGTLTQRSMGLEAVSGMTSYAQLSNDLEKAIADPKVECVVMRIDSPGGEAAGSFDLADKIRAACNVKPVYGLAEDKALSAAYLLGSACKELYVTQSGSVGSIGVLFSHTFGGDDQGSGGKKYTQVIKAGALKGVGATGPIEGSSAWSALENAVAQTHDLFVGKVATYRGMTQADVRGTEAGVFQGKKAVDMGLAAGPMSMDELLSMLAKRGDPEDADLDGDEDGDGEGEEEHSGGMVPALSTAPRGASMEVGMSDKNPAAGGSGAVDLVELKSQIEAVQAENAKLKAKDELSTKAMELHGKAAVIKKHQERSAIVPALLPFVQKMADTMSAEELDKALAAYPVYPGLEPVKVPVAASGTAAQADDGTFQLDADAKRVLKSNGWTEAELKQRMGTYMDVAQIRITDSGAKAVMKDGTLKTMAEINAGRA